MERTKNLALLLGLGMTTALFLANAGAALPGWASADADTSGTASGSCNAMPTFASAEASATGPSTAISSASTWAEIDVGGYDSHSDSAYGGASSSAGVSGFGPSQSSYSAANGAGRSASPPSPCAWIDICSSCELPLSGRPLNEVLPSFGCAAHSEQDEAVFEGELYLRVENLGIYFVGVVATEAGSEQVGLQVDGYGPLSASSRGALQIGTWIPTGIGVSVSFENGGCTGQYL